MDIFIWLLNGILVIAYVLFEHILTVLLAVPMFWGMFNLKKLCDTHFQTQFWPWMAAATVLSLLASVMSPSPVPFFLLVMAIISLVAISLEKFNPANTTWSMIGGMSLYALLGLGFMVMNAYLFSTTDVTSNTMLVQGQNYLGILIAVALYGYPVGYLVLLAKGLFIHPPVENPEVVAEYIRTRQIGGGRR